MASRITPDQRRQFHILLRDGFTIAEAGRQVRVSYASAKAMARALRNSAGREWREQREQDAQEGPVALGELLPEPERALHDIGFFAHRYFGLLLMPWQEQATELIVRLQATEDEEYVVINVAPGTGKSTFFTLVLPAWVTCRQRHIRGMIGSAGHSLARTYTDELRAVLEAPEPLRQPVEAIRSRTAVDPTGCLLRDYGKFKPVEGRWSAEAFQVSQHDGARFRAKEYTWQAFGRGSHFIGTRVGLAIWDDVYDPEDYRTVEAREKLKTWWKDVAEQRLEPGGLMVLQGQRLDADDIYRFALDQKHVEFDAAGEVVGERPKYHHVIYRAHDESKCVGEEGHRRTSAPWPKGCLLFPRRLTWQKLASEQRNNPNFDTIYQQEDTNRSSVLVQKLWITGGQDSTGRYFPGCWDYERGACELPKGFAGPWLSVATVDPSPTRMWAVQWWVYQPATKLRYLMDVYRGPMQAGEFLDELSDGTHVGLAAQWQARSKDLGWPITHWIVEQNAAARFMLQIRHVQRWATANRVSIIGHETHRNKADPKLGIQTIGSLYEYGLVRLPGRPTDPGRVAALKLVDEVTRYPGGSTDDQVLAHWFLEWNLPQLDTPDRSNMPKVRRPGWMRRREREQVPA